jgi:hypothetical protein
MVDFIIGWLIFSIISFIVYGIERIIVTKYYTLRDVFMGLLLAVGGPLYTIYCIGCILATHIVTLLFLIEDFVRDKDMYANVVIIDKADVVYKIKKLLKR